MSRPLAALASLVLAVLGIVFLLPPQDAYACSCGPVSVQRLLSSSEAVFSGEVVDLKRNQKDPAPPPPPNPGSIPPAAPSRIDRVSFRVSEVWKGPQRQTLEVITPRADGVSCGYPFKEGQEYLVYAEGKGEPFETALCSGTQPLSKADEDLALLGNGEELKDGGVALTDTSGVVPAWVVVGLAGLAMVASFLVVVRLVRTG